MKRFRWLGEELPIRWKVYYLLYFLGILTILFTVIAACSGLSTKLGRGELLEEAIQSFHLTLLTQNIPATMRHLPPESRDRWEKTFRCLYQKVRFDDYTIEMVQAHSDLSEARVFVSIASHRLNSLVTHEIAVTEKWIYKNKGWVVGSEPVDFKNVFKECLPDNQDP